MAKKKRSGAAFLTGMLKRTAKKIAGRKYAVESATKKASPTKKPKKAVSKIKQGDTTAKNPSTIKRKTKSQANTQLAQLRAKQRARAKAKKKG